MATFDVPATAPTVNVNGTEYSELTLKTYKQHLNRLAVKSFATVDDLIKKPQDVLNTIQEFVGENSAKARASRRKFLSAIMWVLPPAYKQSSNPYYKSFQTAKDGYESSDRPVVVPMTRKLK
jgi:hypothetical protein